MISKKNSDKNLSLILTINEKLEKIVEFLFPIRTMLVFISSVFTIILSIVS